MDPRLKQALEFSNYQQTFNTQKKVLKENVYKKLTYGYNGGIFYINTTLLTFVENLLNQNRLEHVVFLDSNENPIMVTNLQEFRDEIYDRYFSSVQEYYNEYEKMKKARSVEKLLDQ